MRPPKDQAEIDARNQWATYQRGWNDAARGKSDDPLVVEHHDDRIMVAYISGRGDYEAARQDAFRAARKRYKVPGTPGSDILRGG